MFIKLFFKKFVESYMSVMSMVIFADSNIADVVKKQILK